jgi:hypothetical protein
VGYGARCIFLEIFGSTIIVRKSRQNKYKKNSRNAAKVSKKLPKVSDFHSLTCFGLDASIYMLLV